MKVTDQVAPAGRPDSANVTALAESAKLATRVPVPPTDAEADAEEGELTMRLPEDDDQDRNV